MSCMFPVLLCGARTPIGTSRKGALANTPPEKLAATAIAAALKRSGLPHNAVDDVIMAESLAGGGAIARHAAIEVGLIGSAGVAINRHCAGGLSAVGFAAASVMSGMDDVIIAGGVNSSSFFPRMMQVDPDTGDYIDYWLPPTHPDTPEAPNKDMSITVGWNAAKRLGLTREELDSWAVRSHQRAISAIDARHFEAEIAPIKVRSSDGIWREFSVDEHPRRNSSIEKLRSLPVLHPEIEGFNITAGNSSGMNDAAAATVVTCPEVARDSGVEPLARILGWAAIGVEPSETGLAVSKVIDKLLARTGRKKSDVGLWEINEAFASVPLAACRVMGLDEETVNVSGSGCSLGHPIGASGVRMLLTLAHDIKRRGGGLGIAAMCAGGGQAGAVLIEV